MILQMISYEIAMRKIMRIAWDIFKIDNKGEISFQRIKIIFCYDLVSYFDLLKILAIIDNLNCDYFCDIFTFHFHCYILLLYKNENKLEINSSNNFFLNIVYIYLFILYWKNFLNEVK